MALETTTSSMTGVVNASLVESTIVLALSEQPGFAVRNCRELNLVGKAALAAKIPTQTSYWGTPADHGASVDTEFDGRRGNALGNTQVSASSVSITPVEYGVAHQIIDRRDRHA